MLKMCNSILKLKKYTILQNVKKFLLKNNYTFKYNHSNKYYEYKKIGILFYFLLDKEPYVYYNNKADCHSRKNSAV